MAKALRRDITTNRVYGRNAGFVIPGNNGHNMRGRPKGAGNKTTRLLKEAILAAVHNVGHPVFAGVRQDGSPIYRRGTGGLIGYLEWLATNHPAQMAMLLGKVLPLQTNDARDGEATTPVVYETVQEVRAAMKERGLTEAALALLADFGREPGRHRRSDRGNVIKPDFEVIEER
jgi:hypothetical protein